MKFKMKYGFALTVIQRFHPMADVVKHAEKLEK